LISEPTRAGKRGRSLSISNYERLLRAFVDDERTNLWSWAST
jgi:hypothetical protein